MYMISVYTYISEVKSLKNHVRLNFSKKNALIYTSIYNFIYLPTIVFILHIYMKTVNERG